MIERYRNTPRGLQRNRLEDLSQPQAAAPEQLPARMDDLTSAAHIEPPKRENVEERSTTPDAARELSSVRPISTIRETPHHANATSARVGAGVAGGLFAGALGALFQTAAYIGSALAKPGGWITKKVDAFAGTVVKGYQDLMYKKIPWILMWPVRKLFGTNKGDGGQGGAHGGGHH